MLAAAAAAACWEAEWKQSKRRANCWQKFALSFAGGASRVQAEQAAAAAAKEKMQNQGGQQQKRTSGEKFAVWEKDYLAFKISKLAAAAEWNAESKAAAAAAAAN